ncbi:MAG: YgiT-type zinc finger protein [Deltaproteobacteria bacterium]|nr:YgiT-type zinc finger protein [Deltaproteobacteria bacterium]MBI3388933.1 YgiT-type zinc finger protein [Deltaproteobacteria bacterium]
MTNVKRRYDYGKCHACGETMQARRIEQDFWINGKLLVVDGVPAGVCPQCGERVVKGDIGRRLATLTRDVAAVRRARTMKVPVLRLGYKVA